CRSRSRCPTSSTAGARSARRTPRWPPWRAGRRAWSAGCWLPGGGPGWCRSP
ncbi:MAG: hypothetical protein AVDCRST_MAG54-1107, partial [uncultured Actinomycetospora sp.]